MMKIKYFITFLLLMFCAKCFASDLYAMPDFKRGEILFTSSSKNISVIDPTPQTNASAINFPGGRGPNQLIIYTPNFGDRTNTNEFGTEAVVQDNVVTMISGANSFIPQDGIVISGHGSAKTWMTKNITVGTKVYINKKDDTISVYTTSESYLFEANEKIAETNSMINFYKSKLTDYDYTNSKSHIEAAQKYLKKAKKEVKNQEHIKKYSEMAITEANNAMSDVLPDMPNELKGVWIRPTQTSEQQIVDTLNSMQKLGINNVFLETFYHGMTIFSSNVMKQYGFTEQNPQFCGINPLKIWVTEAHKRNIKVHIWFQSFYVGNKPPLDNPTSILAVNPQWGNKIRIDYKSDKPTCSKSEHNGYFLDPANPQVQEFLTQLIDEIITVYKPDGINLDYIRYPQTISKNESGQWGYSEYARQDFEEIYGVDPVELKRNDKLWNDWDNYRRENVTNFVRKIGNLGKCKNVYISTVIFPDVEVALSTKQQDWRTWSKRKYIDGFTPLFLTYDPKMVANMMKNIKDVKSSSTDLFAGIFVTFMSGSEQDLVRQIHETRKLNANGYILFDWAHSNIAKYNQVLAPNHFSHVIDNKKKYFIFTK